MTKKFGELIAVDNLNLDVFPGEVFGFLGLNGAGKTTSIRVRLDLLRPTLGRVVVLGYDCRQAPDLQVRSKCFRYTGLPPVNESASSSQSSIRRTDRRW
jgi:ABC-2 type transport system ATP-binding protein